MTTRAARRVRCPRRLSARTCSAALACILVPLLAVAAGPAPRQEAGPDLLRAQQAVASVCVHDGLGATVATGPGFFIAVGRIVVPRALLEGARGAGVMVGGKEQRVTAVLAEDRQAMVVVLAVDLPDGAPPFLTAAPGALKDHTAAREVGADGAWKAIVVEPAHDVPGLGLVHAVENPGGVQNGDAVVDGRGELIGAAIAGDIGGGERFAFVVPAARLVSMRRIAPLPLLDWSLQSRQRDTGPWLVRGKALALARRYDEAVKAFDTAATMEPADADAWIALGNCQRAQNHGEASIEAWRRAAAAQPANPRFHHELAVDLSDAGRYDQAATEFAEVARLRPNDSEARFNLGSTLGTLGRHEAEYKAYQEVLALEPTHVRALKNLGMTCLQMERFDEAVTTFTRAERLAPADPDIETGLGVSYFRARNVEAALSALRRALQLAPTFVKAHFSLGAIYAATGDHAGARQECQALRSLDKVKADQLCRMVEQK